MQGPWKLPLETVFSEEPTYRGRLLLGLCHALAEEPYADVTVADVVRQARVSKRTFYEHFRDKQDCFLTAYSIFSDELLERVSRAAAGADEGEDKLRAATRAYFSALDDSRPLVRAFLSEVHAVGDEALAMRRQVMARFAELLRALVEQERCTRSELMPLTPQLATAVMGGLHELLLSTVEQGGYDQIRGLSATAEQLILAVVKAQPEPETR